MKIRVLSISRLDQYIYKNHLEYKIESYSDISDEQFKALNEEIEHGWSFSSWQEFVREFNADSSLAPVPSEHILRVFPFD